MERTAGIDLASEEHRLVVVEESGRRLEERRYSHSEDGVSALVRRLSDLDVSRVAIERPNGLVVDRLLDAGISVVAIHPNQLAASRDRYRSGGGKSDGFDAYVLAELARTDMHRFNLLAPDSDETKALRTLTRAREDLVEQRVALANQLRAQLDSFCPAPPGSSPTSTRRSASPSWSATPAPKTHAASAPNASPASSPATATAAAATRPNCSSGCARPPTAEQANSSTKPAAPSYWRSSPHSNRWSSRSVCSPARSAASSTTTPTARPSNRSSATPNRPSPQPNCWPRSATAANATPPAARSKRSPAKPPSPSNPAKRRSPASAGPATKPSAAPSTSSLTAAATTTPGPQTSTNAPAPEATTTPTQSASSAAPGPAYSGASGKTTNPTTPTATATSTASSPHRVDTGRSCSLLAGPGVDRHARPFIPVVLPRRDSLLHSAAFVSPIGARGPGTVSHALQSAPAPFRDRYEGGTSDAGGRPRRIVGRVGP